MMTRRAALEAVGMAAGVSLATVLFVRTGGPRALADGGPWVAAAVAAALVGNNVACALRWRTFLNPSPTPVDAVRRYAEATFLSVVVPGGVAGDAYRTVTTTAGRKQGLTGVLADRLVGGAVSLLLAVPALGVAVGWWADGVLAAAAVAVTGIWLVAHGSRRGLLQKMEGAIREAAQDRRRLATAVLLSLVYHVCNVAFVGAVAAASGAHATTTDVILAAPLIAVAGAVPSLHGASPAYLALAWLMARTGGGAGSTAAALAVLALTQASAALLGALSLGLRRSMDRRVLA